MLEREIQDSSDELDKISPIYDNQVIQEKEISKGFVYVFLQLLQFISTFLFHVSPTPPQKKKVERGDNKELPGFKL